MKSEYYQLVAQIIPVLFLALSIQSTFLRKTYTKAKAARRGDHVMAFLIMATIMMLAEYVSLKNVYSGGEEEGDLIVSIFGLALPTVYIFIEYILHVYGKIGYAWQVMYHLISVIVLVFVLTEAISTDWIAFLAALLAVGIALLSKLDKTKWFHYRSVE